MINIIMTTPCLNIYKPRRKKKQLPLSVISPDGKIVEVPWSVFELTDAMKPIQIKRRRVKFLPSIVNI